MRQRAPVASCKRQIVQLPVDDGLAHSGILSLQERSRGRHGDRLLHIARGKMTIDRQDLLHVNVKSLHHIFFEATGLRHDAVGARNQVVKHIGAGGRGFCCGAYACCIVGEYDVCVPNHRAGRVFDRPSDLSAINLGHQAAG